MENRKTVLNPNPSEGRVKVMGLSDVDQLFVYGALGDRIGNIHWKYLNGEVRLDISELVSGMYVLRIQTKNGVINHIINKTK